MKPMHVHAWTTHLGYKRWGRKDGKRGGEETKGDWHPLFFQEGSTGWLFSLHGAKKKGKMEEQRPFRLVLPHAWCVFVVLAAAGVKSVPVPYLFLLHAVWLILRQVYPVLYCVVPASEGSWVSETLQHYSVSTNCFLSLFVHPTTCFTPSCHSPLPVGSRLCRKPFFIWGCSTAFCHHPFRGRFILSAFVLLQLVPGVLLIPAGYKATNPHF